MFSSKDQLQKKTGPYGIGRLSYLQSLVDEYQETESVSSQLQVVANLANFAYDPINYEFFRQLNILDIFLDIIASGDNATENGAKLTSFSIGGLCNCCLDKKNKKILLEGGAVKIVSNCLSSSDEQTVLSAITTLMYLMSPESREEITNVPIKNAMRRLAAAPSPRVRNLAEIFLQDKQVSQA